MIIKNGKQSLTSREIFRRKSLVCDNPRFGRIPYRDYPHNIWQFLLPSEFELPSMGSDEEPKKKPVLTRHPVCKSNKLKFILKSKQGKKVSKEIKNTCHNGCNFCGSCFFFDLSYWSTADTIDFSKLNHSVQLSPYGITLICYCMAMDKLRLA